ncbi:uncharacterized protein G2W53_026838 [Senna tora]|uniref:Uncharacterized protein n=1 Tax=Senna tora TaxID=362788 RepID=A0A834TFQ1_9FABA|nr:uncharacterized protein G2W53_026838 [Senna tora]
MGEGVGREGGYGFWCGLGVRLGGGWVKGWKEIGVWVERERRDGFGGVGYGIGIWVMGVEALERERRDGFGEGLVRLTAWWRERWGSQFWWRKGNGISLVGFGGVVEDGVLGYGEEEERLEREKEG